MSVYSLSRHAVGESGGWNIACNDVVEKDAGERGFAIGCVQCCEVNTCVSKGLVGWCKDGERTRALKRFQTGQQLLIDGASLRNLDLLRNSRNGSREGSLVQVLDRTRTPMGGRRLAGWVAEAAPDRPPRHAFGVMQPDDEAITAIAAWFKGQQGSTALSFVPIIGHFECRDACMTRLRAQPAQLRP